MSNTPAAAASHSGVASKKDARRRARRTTAVSLARSAKPPAHSWWQGVDDMLKRSPAVARISVVDAEASALISATLPAFVRDRLLPRADAYRRHGCASRLQPKHIQLAMESLLGLCTPEQCTDVMAMLAQAEADKDAFLDSHSTTTAADTA